MFNLHIEISCIGQINHCKTRFFCFSCSSAEALLGDLSVRCPTSAIITSELLDMLETLMGKFVKSKEFEAADTH